jgi:hypothetical protein
MILRHIKFIFHYLFIQEADDGRWKLLQATASEG